jgi:hypothetical protein
VSQLSEAVAGGGGQAVVQRVPPGARATLEEASRAAFVSGLNQILIIATVVALTGAVLSFALVRRRDFVTAGEAAPAAA